MANKQNPVKEITIKGFKSIKNLESFRLNDLNVLIGSNGAGKSNFVSFFKLLRETVENRLKFWVSTQGGADRILSYGIKETSELSVFIKFVRNGYKFTLAPSSDGSFIFASETVYFNGYYGERWIDLGAGHSEAILREKYEKSQKGMEYDYVFSSINSWQVYHFHDTSDTAGVKRKKELHDNEFLRNDASNLAAFLNRMRSEYPEHYEQIRKTVSLAIPFFDDFILKPETLPSGEQLISLLWKQKNSDYPLWPSQLSDGSIRFICLTTALLQPVLPSTIIIDEPELGLHPYAISLLGSLLRSAATKTQVIVSTQSVPLLNEFSLNDIIVVERENGESKFKKLNEEDFTHWLEEYSIGELWEKNVLGGRPV